MGVFLCVFQLWQPLEEEGSPPATAGEKAELQKDSKSRHYMEPPMAELSPACVLLIPGRE